MHQSKITDFEKPPSGYVIEVTVEGLKEDVERVTRIIDSKPSIRQYEKYGRYSTSLVDDRVGSWSELMALLGYERPKTGPQEREYTNEELLEELKRISDLLGKSPSRTDVDEHALVSKSLYHYRFGSFNRAKKLAGLETVGVGGEHAYIGDLIDEMIDVAIEVGRTPYKRDMEKKGEFSPATYQRKFGSWSEAHKIAGLPARRAGQKLGYGYVESVRNYGSNWKEQRSKAIERDRYTCQSCGGHINELRDGQTTGLEVHHIVPIREFDEPEDANFQENLITLCSSCHHKAEGSKPAVDADTLSGR